VVKDEGFRACEPRNPTGSANSLTKAETTSHDHHYAALAHRLSKNLPAQVLLSDPIVLYDALDGVFPFWLEWIPTAEVESDHMPS
jgi:hypothetical protein